MAVKLRLGRSTRGTSFIPKHSNAAVGTYDPSLDPTRSSPICVSVGNATRPDIEPMLTKDANYDPSIDYTRSAAPLFSLGYSQPMSYETDVPAPGTYENRRPESSISFNKTESYFTSANRPNPYGEEARFPGVGAYHLMSDRKPGTHSRFGTGDRPPVDVCPDSPIIFYNSKSDFGREGRGCSLG